MDPIVLKYIISGVCLLVMAGGVFGVFHNKLREPRLKEGERPRAKGLSIRSIQAFTILLVVPGVIILGVLEILHSDAIAAILGGLIGYVLSSLSEHETEQTKRLTGGVQTTETDE